MLTLPGLLFWLTTTSWNLYVDISHPSPYKTNLVPSCVASRYMALAAPGSLVSCEKGGSWQPPLSDRNRTCMFLSFLDNLHFYHLLSRTGACALATKLLFIINIFSNGLQVVGVCMTLPRAETALASTVLASGFNQSWLPLLYSEGLNCIFVA